MSDRLPAIIIDTLREPWDRIDQLDEQILEIERRLKVWHKEDANASTTSLGWDG